MHAHAVLVALALILAPLGARAADLVVWWDEGYYAEESEAIAEVIVGSAFAGRDARLEPAATEVDVLWTVRIDGAQAGGPTDAGRALSHVGELLDKRSVVLFFSDLLDAEPEGTIAKRGDAVAARGPVAERLRQLRARGHDVVVFHLLDPDEIELPFDDLSYFQGVEPGGGQGADRARPVGGPVDGRVVQDVRHAVAARLDVVLDPLRRWRP